MQVTNLANQKLNTSVIASKTQGRGNALLRAITSSPKIAIGLGIVALFVLLALAAPLLTPYDPTASVVRGSLPPSPAHILGTTSLGQDMFSQLLYGARVSIAAGFAAAAGSTILQVIFGLTAAYFSGVVDEAINLLINVFLALPGLPLAVVIAGLASVANAAGKNEVTITLVVLFTSWAYGARVLRSQTLSLKEREFVASARATGETPFRLIFAEILPNEIALVTSTFITTFVYAVGAEVALEFLGLGNTSQATWGNILFWAQNENALIIGEWWQFVPAGLCVAVLCASLTFINFGIDEIANPQLRREKRPRIFKQRKDAVA